MSDDPISPALCAVAEQHHRVSLDAVDSLAAAFNKTVDSPKIKDKDYRVNLERYEGGGGDS